MSLLQFDTGPVPAVTTLTQLVTDNDAADANIQIQLGPSSPWRHVHRGREVVKPGSHPLLNSTHLTAAKYAHCIDFRNRTDGLDAAALDELKGVAKQTQVLMLAAIAEGLHRRLFEEKKRVEALSETRLRRCVVQQGRPPCR